MGNTTGKISVQLFETRADEAARNMSLDEALLDAAAAGAQTPCLRFYSWRPPALTIGYSLDAAAETDSEACREAGAPVVRRITGGGAVFHDNELTYSVVLPLSAAPGPIENSYGLICGAIAAGLDFLKKGFEFNPVNDIIYHSKKVSGSAQVRRGGWLLQHGTIILGLDPEKMFSLLRVPEGKFRKHGLEAARQRTGSLAEVLGREVTFEETAAAVLRGIGTIFEIESGPRPFPPDVVDAALRLEPKYRSDEWNLHRVAVK
jgi:lipoate---protein ligase